jgi:hypothetical protein
MNVQLSNRLANDRIADLRRARRPFFSRRHVDPPSRPTRSGGRH